jgi:hypothetical protein
VPPTSEPKKVLDYWNEPQLQAFFADLLQSKTALDATQIDSLKNCIEHLPMPDVQVAMKETLMLVVDACLALNQETKAGNLFRSPTDLLRYLWYKKTGSLQITEPRTLVRRHKSNRSTSEASGQFVAKLKLHYTRNEGLRIAKWLNAILLSAVKACEIMHPKRGIWVRVIRASRLTEFAKRPGLKRFWMSFTAKITWFRQVFCSKLACVPMRKPCFRCSKNALVYLLAPSLPTCYGLEPKKR